MGLQEIIAVSNLSNINPNTLKNMAGFAAGGAAALLIFGTFYAVDNYITPRVAPYVRRGWARIPGRKKEDEGPAAEETIYSFLKPTDS